MTLVNLVLRAHWLLVLSFLGTFTVCPASCPESLAWLSACQRAQVGRPASVGGQPSGWGPWEFVDGHTEMWVVPQCGWCPTDSCLFQRVHISLSFCYLCKWLWAMRTASFALSWGTPLVSLFKQWKGLLVLILSQNWNRYTFVYLKKKAPNPFSFVYLLL